MSPPQIITERMLQKVVHNYIPKDTQAKAINYRHESQRGMAKEYNLTDLGLQNEAKFLLMKVAFANF